MEWNAIGVRAPALSSFQIITQSDPIAPDLLSESRSSRQRNCLYLGLRDFGGFWSSGSFCVGPNERWEWICRERRPPLLFRCKSLRPWAGSLCQAGQGAEAKPPLFPWSTCILTAKTLPSFAFSLPTTLLLPV